MIEFKKGRHVVGLWFTALENVADWMMVAYHDEDMAAGAYRLDGRLRIYAEDDPHNDPFSGSDEKKWFHGHRENTNDDEVIEDLNKMLASVGRILLPGGKSHTLILKTDDFDKIMAEFKKLPFMHIMPEPECPDEIEVDE